MFTTRVLQFFLDKDVKRYPSGGPRFRHRNKEQSQELGCGCGNFSFIRRTPRCVLEYIHCRSDLLTSSLTPGTYASSGYIEVSRSPPVSIFRS